MELLIKLKKVGRPKIKISQDWRYANAILALAIGKATSRKEVAKLVHAPNWDNTNYGIRKKLIDAALITEKESARYNEKNYDFNWDTAIALIKQICEEDLKIQKKELARIVQEITVAMEDEIKKSKKSKIKKIDKNKKTTKKAIEAINNELLLLDIDLSSLKKLNNEATHTEKELEVVTNEINSVFELSEDEKSWLISQLINYFTDIFYLIKNKQVLLRTEYKKNYSLEQILREFMLSFYAGPLTYGAKRGHYFNYAKKPEEKFFSFFKKYAYYYNFKPTWLILFKPNFMKEGKMIAKEYQSYLEEQYSGMVPGA